MPRQAEISYDVASAIVLGKREIQEDALAADFQVGSEFGFTVLSDGMGGHAAGDVASNIVVTEVFSELKLQSIDVERTVEGISGILSEAALSANQCLREHTSRDPATTGMGATLVAPVLARNKLFWISIGDSPLFLFRDNQLSQLNEDHSMAPQIDCMVKSGLISETDGRDHPDRNCLTSALLGDEIPADRLPQEPFTLLPGDIVVAASDGLQFLSDRQIQRILSEDGDADSSIIAERLLAGIATLDDPVSGQCLLHRDQGARPCCRRGAPDLGKSKRARRMRSNAPCLLRQWTRNRQRPPVPDCLRFLAGCVSSIPGCCDDAAVAGKGCDRTPDATAICRRSAGSGPESGQDACCPAILEGACHPFRSDRGRQVDIVQCPRRCAGHAGRSEAAHDNAALR